MISLFLIILVQLLVFLKTLINQENENIIEEQNIIINQVEYEIEKVKDRNIFYTVNSAVDKYLYNLYEEKNDILFSYLDKEYIQENNITKNNVLQKIGKLDEYKTFTVKEMYEQKITDNIIQYFAYGVIKGELEEGRPEEEDFYISIKIDNKSNTFSVLPNTYID